MQKLSFVIPCYRSEHTIRPVVSELLETLSCRSVYEYEIILVNDGSPDGVWDVIKEMSEENGHITGISLSRNFGQHAALMAGYACCCGEYIVSMDDDGQMPLEALFQLIDKLGEGYDVVYAYYEEEVRRSLYRRFGTWMARKMSEIMLGSSKEIKGSSFYIARKFVIDEMIKYKNAYPYLAGLVLRTTKNISCIPTKHRERMAGKSGYSFRKLLALWVNGFTAFSVKPLRVAEVLGIVCSFTGFVGGAAVVIRKLVEPAILLGYSSTIAVIFFIGGVIMMLLGMIGEYVGRIYISINNAPQYVVKETTEKQQ